MAVDTIETTQAAVEDILREVTQMKTVVTEAVDDGVKSALRAVKQGRDYAEDTIHDARYAIKRNPFQAMGIIFAAGIAIGSLFTLITMRD